MSTQPATPSRPSLRICVLIVLVFCVVGAALGAVAGIVTHHSLTLSAIYACAAEAIALLLAVGLCAGLRRRSRSHPAATVSSTTGDTPVAGMPTAAAGEQGHTGELPQTVATNVFAPTGEYPLPEPEQTAAENPVQEAVDAEHVEPAPEAPAPESDPVDPAAVRKTELEQRFGMSLPVLVQVERDQPEQGYADLLHQIRSLGTMPSLVLCASAGRGHAQGELAAGLTQQAGREQLRSAVVQVRGDDSADAALGDPAAIHQALAGLSETTDVVVIDAGGWDEPMTASLRALCDLVVIESSAPTPKKQLQEVMATLGGKKFLTGAIPTGLVMIRDASSSA